MSGYRVNEHCADDADVVDAVMFEEPVVLGRQERVFDQIRNLLVRGGNTPLLANLRNQAAVTRIDAQRHLELNATHRLRARQRG